MPKKNVKIPTASQQLEMYGVICTPVKFRATCKMNPKHRLNPGEIKVQFCLGGVPYCVPCAFEIILTERGFLDKKIAFIEKMSKTERPV